MPIICLPVFITLHLDRSSVTISVTNHLICQVPCRDNCVAPCLLLFVKKFCQPTFGLGWLLYSTWKYVLNSMGLRVLPCCILSLTMARVSVRWEIPFHLVSYNFECLYFDWKQWQGTLFNTFWKSMFIQICVHLSNRDKILVGHYQSWTNLSCAGLFKWQHWRYEAISSLINVSRALHRMQFRLMGL